MRAAPFDRPLRVSDQPLIVWPSSVSDAASSSTLSKIRLRSAPGKRKRSIAAWSVGAIAAFRPFSNVTAYLYGLAVSFSWREGSARAERPVGGAPAAVDGITWNVWRSPIHGLGSWLIASA